MTPSLCCAHRRPDPGTDPRRWASIDLALRFRDLIGLVIPTGPPRAPAVLRTRRTNPPRWVAWHAEGDRNSRPHLHRCAVSRQGTVRRCGYVDWWPSSGLTRLLRRGCHGCRTLRWPPRAVRQVRPRKRCDRRVRAGSQRAPESGARRRPRSAAPWRARGCGEPAAAASPRLPTSRSPRHPGPVGPTLEGAHFAAGPAGSQSQAAADDFLLDLGGAAENPYFVKESTM